MAQAIKERPARLQVDPESIPDSDKPPQSGNAFNIWYLRWSGGDGSNNFTKSNFKVDVKKDSGYTKAPSNSPICLFFSRGCCYLGKKCSYLHRLPNEKDYFVPTQDCFGRDKTADYKDDMSGVGSFSRVNRTLYVGGIHMNDRIENVLTKYFQEFGSIEKIRVLYNKSCAFITFRLEYEAQFAKEAMQNQSLDGNEILNIKWANEDPNPEAQKQEKRRLEELALNTVRNLLNDSNKKRKTQDTNQSLISVEEPTDEIESTKDQKLIQASESPTSESNSKFFSSSINSLKNLKNIQKITKVTTLSSVLGDYSSDEEE